MIDYHWPFWANIILIAVLLLAKYFILDRVTKTMYYTNAVKGKGWMATLNISAGVNALVTAIVFVFAVHLPWAILLGVADFAIHWLIGYWRIKKHWPVISSGNVTEAKGWVTSAWKWVTTIQVASYVSMASWVLDFVDKHPNLSTLATKIFHDVMK